MQQFGEGLRYVAVVLKSRFGEERGASLVEYALLVSLIAMACFAALQFFGSTTANSFSASASQISP
jgi:Flp pilus assembly pilin Flp